MKREIKTTLALDGEKVFKAGLADASRELRVLSSEMKANKATFSGNEQSLESLTSRGKLFERQVAQQKEIVTALSRAVQESSEKYGDADRKTDGYRIQLNNATAALAKMENNLEQNKAALDEQAAEAEKAANKLEKFKAKAAEVGSSLQSMGGKLKGFGMTMATTVTAPIVAAGAAAFKFGSDLEDSIGATNQIFGKQSQEMQKWADGLNNYYGIAEAEALTYADTMGAMLQNIGGLSKQEAAKQSQTLIKLAGDLTAMYGGTTANAVQALTGALKGNNTMLDNYGMAANDAMIKTKALEMGLYSGKGEMDLATKQAATLALIMEQSGAAMGQAGRESEGASGTLRGLITELKNVATETGQSLIPVVTPFLAKIKELVEGFGQMSPAMQQITIIGAGVAAAIGPVLLVIGGMASGLGSIISVAGAVSGAMATAGLSFGALAAPIAVAVAAVVGLVVAIKDLWNNNEAFRNGVKEIWDDIKSSMTDVINFLKNLWTQYGDHLVSAGRAAWEAVKDIISTVTQIIGQIVAAFLNIMTGDWTGAWENIKNIVGIGAEGVKKVIQNMSKIIGEIFSALVDMALNWGRNLLQSFIDGIKEKFGDLVDIAEKVAATVADFIGFESPTKKGPGRYIEDWGGNMVTAFADGMNKELSSLEKSLGKMPIQLNPGRAAAGNTSSNVYNYHVNVTVRDGEDLLRTLRRLGVAIP